MVLKRKQKKNMKWKIWLSIKSTLLAAHLVTTMPFTVIAEANQPGVVDEGADESPIEPEEEQPVMEESAPLTPSLFLENIATLRGIGKLGIEQKVGYPGSTVSVPIPFSSDGSIVGVQFDMAYDIENLTFLGFETEGSLLSEDLFTYEKLNNGHLRVIVVNQTNEAIPASQEEPLLVALFQVKDQAQTLVNGEVLPITLSDVSITNTEGQELKSRFTLQDGEIRIDYVPPSIQFQRYEGDETEAKVHVLVEADGTGSGISSLYYAEGIQPASYFEKGGAYQSVVDGRFAITRNTAYTVCAVDEAGHRTVRSIFVMGDVNFNQLVDVTDWADVINFILERKQPTPAQKLVADMSRDNDLNVIDPVLLANLIMEGNPETNQPPVASELIDQLFTMGKGDVKVPIAGAFTDVNGDQLRIHATSGNEAIATVTLVEDELTIHAVQAGETVVTLTAYDGNGGMSINTFTVTVEPNHAPIISDISIQGEAEVGQTLTGNYAFQDEDGDQEGTSHFQWYRSDDALGANKVPLANANTKNYTLSLEDAHKYISFEVTPVALTGEIQGQPNQMMITQAVTDSAPVITGVEQDLFYPGSVTPSSPSQDIASVALYRASYQGALDISSFNKVDGYILGTPVTEEGYFYLAVTDQGGHVSEIFFGLDKKMPSLDSHSPVTYEPFTGPSNNPLEWDFQDSITFKLSEAVRKYDWLDEMFHDPRGQLPVLTIETLNEAAALSWPGATFGTDAHLLTSQSTQVDGVNYGQSFTILLGSDARIPAEGGVMILNPSSIIDPAGNQADQPIAITIPALEERVAIMTSKRSGRAASFQGAAGMSVASTPSPNHAPSVVNTIPAQSFVLDEEDSLIDISQVFEDIDGDALSFAASSTNYNVASVTVQNQKLMIKTKTPGSARIVLVANDGRGSKAATNFVLTVLAPNQVPEVVTPVTDQEWTLGSGQQQLDLTNVFRDQDGDDLIITASSDDPGVASISVDGKQLTVNPLSEGTVQVTLEANDGKGGIITTTFTITVKPIPNQDPQVIGSFYEQVITAGITDGRVIDLRPLFTDTDGDPLTYTAAASSTQMVNPVVNGNNLTLQPGTVAGETTVVITADDGKGGTATYNLAIRNAPLKNRMTIRTKQGIADVFYDLSKEYPNQTSFKVYHGNANQTLTGPIALNGTVWKEAPSNDYVWIVGPDGTAVVIDTVVVPQGTSELFFSEYLDVGENRKAIELYYKDNVNPGPISGGYEVAVYQYRKTENRIISYSLPIQLFYPNMTYHMMDSAFYDFFELTNAWYYNDEVSLYGGTSFDTVALVLKKNGMILDVLGDPASKEPILPQGGTIVRKKGIYTGSPSFSLNGEWDVYPRGTFNMFGTHTP